MTYVLVYTITVVYQLYKRAGGITGEVEMAAAPAEPKEPLAADTRPRSGINWVSGPPPSGHLHHGFPLWTFCRVQVFAVSRF